MNIKNYIISSLVGFVAYWFTSFLLYGILFTHLHPEGSENLSMIALGSLLYSFFIGYIWHQWAGFKDWMSGLKGGAIIGSINALSAVCFMYASMELNIVNMVEEFIGMLIGTSILGATIAFVNGKLSK